MSTFNPPNRTLMLGYAVAIVTVVAAEVGLGVMTARWKTAAPVATLLMAVIVSTWFGGTKPGLLAAALSLLGFDYYLVHLADPSIAGAIQIIRLLSLALVACYVVWVTATERGAAEWLRRAQDRLQQKNETLRAENAERRRVEEQLRVSEAQFRALAEGAPAAIFIYQEDKICYANPAASVISGYSREELCEMNSWDTAHPDFRDAIREPVRARQRGERTPFRYELKILTKAGEERWLDFTDGTFELAGRPAVVGIAFDITERKCTEAAARESQRLLQSVLRTLPVGVVVMDRAGDITLGNEASKRIWGDWIVSGGHRWARSTGFWHDSGRKIAPTEWASVRALSEGQTSLDELIDIETYDGQHKTIQNSAAPIRNAEGLIVGAVTVNEDVTERVRAQKALHESANHLQRLSRRLLAVQEEERRHLSRELHDEFGQLLASIALHLHAVKRLAGEAAQPSLDECMTLLQHAGAQVRSLALELRPILLETGGLAAALRWLAEQHHQRTGIAIEVAGELSDVPPDLAIACFRVVQEALTNVVRHAHAQRVWIELSARDGVLDLLVRDDGVGFDVVATFEQAANRGNLGLLGMKERVQILGGRLQVDSAPGQGTRIRVSLPFPESTEAFAEHVT
jgi:PAS domain S-box-containing protein